MPKVKVNNTEINYSDTGQGEPLIFIHGLGSCLQDWEHQIQFFRHTHRVIAVDVRGHGDSSIHPMPYSMKHHVEDLRALTKELGLSKFSLIGLSMGGMIAFQWGVSYPEELISLTIINSGPEVIPKNIKEHSLLWFRRLLTEVLGLRVLGKVLAKNLFPLPEQWEIRKEMVERWGKLNKEAYRCSTNAIVGWSVTDELSKIKSPCLIISADNDYTPVSVKAEYMQLLHDAQLVVIKNSKHATPIDQPMELNRAISEFLRQETAMVS